MNEYIRMFVLLVEILTVLVYMHVSFKQKIRLDKYIVVVSVISWCVYLLINNGVLPQVCSIFVYVLIWFYCFLKFKLSIGRTISRFLFGFIMVAFTETLMICISTSIDSYYNEWIVLSLLSIIALVIAIVIYVIIVLHTQKVSYHTNRILVMRVLLIGSVFVALLIDYYKNNGIVRVYTIVIIAFLILVFLYTCLLEQSQKEVEVKKLELEMQKIYGGAYEELLTEVRKRQHDFKNQLGAIYSMHLVAESLDDLKLKQKEYGDKLMEDCKYDAILSNCNNSVLAGYIYHRCLSCGSLGINVIYDIHVDKAECSLALHELIEILGILIDNACENVMVEDIQNKSIKLDIIESEAEIRLSVANPAKYLTSKEIDDIFKPGYSTKGTGRGIGLARVRELLVEYGEEIKVINKMVSDINWIEFEIIITKKSAA